MMARSRCIVAIVCAIAGVGALFAPALTMAAGNVTAEAQWLIPGTIGRIGSDDMLWIGFTDETGTDLAAMRLAVVWWQDTSALFPVGKVSLLGAAELLPAGSNAVAVRDGLYRLDVATVAAPGPGHTYAVTVSHQPEQGVFGVRIADVDQGRTVVSVVRDDVAPGLVMGRAAAGMQLSGEAVPIAPTVAPYFTPIGVTWLWRRDTAPGGSSYILHNKQAVQAADRLVAELNVPVALPGAWRFALQAGDDVIFQKQLDATSGSIDVPLAEVTDDWLGLHRLTLQYVDAEHVLISDAVDLIAGSVDVAWGQPTVDTTTGRLYVPLTVDSSFPTAVTLTLRPTIHEIVWDEAALRYTPVPVPLRAEPVEIAVDLTASRPVDTLLDLAAPSVAGTFTLQLDGGHDIDHDITFTVTGGPTPFTTVQPQVQFKVATYNVWATEQWPRRQAAFQAVVDAMQPDILALQELRPQTMMVLDDILPHHDRVRDTFIGWVYEGNVYWSTELFDLVEYGAEDIGIYETSRRLFWVRLRLKSTGDTMLVGNAHYTWDGHARILAEGGRPRTAMARRTVDVLDALAHPGEPVIFVGDLNESGEAIDVLRRGGLRDSVGTKGEALQHTHPADPAMGSHRIIIDWQLHRGPLHVMNSEVVTYFHEGIVPSDHKPVAVVYGLVP